MFCKFIVTLALFVASSYGAICGRDIPCLASHAQMTFLGRVVSVEQTNSTYFSAEVQPLCTMHSTVANTKIDDEEFLRTVRIDGFGTHAGGSCNADTGIVGDTNIFFVWVNASTIHGVARRFGLFDPCYGAFQYNDANAQELNNFMATHESTVQTPIGADCPADAGKPATNPDGTPAVVNLEAEDNSSAVFKYTVNVLTFLAAFLALYYM